MHTHTDHPHQGIGASNLSLRASKGLMYKGGDLAPYLSVNAPKTPTKRSPDVTATASLGACVSATYKASKVD